MPTPGFSFQTRTVLGHAHAAEVQSTPWGPVLLAKTSLDSLEISRLDDATLAAGPSYTFSDHFEWPLSWHVTADGFLLSYQGQGPTTEASVTRSSLFDSNLHETWSGRILPNDNLSRPLACRGGACLLENNQAPRHAYIATFGASGVTTRPWTEADRTVFDRCPDFMSVRDGAVLMPNNTATLMAQSGACATASFVTFPDLRTPYLCAEVPGRTDVCDPVITRFATTRTHVVAAEVHSDAVSAASLLLRVFRSDSLQQEVTRLTTTLPNGARIKGLVHFENGLFGVIYGITNPYTDSLEAWLRPVYLPQAITLTP